MWRALSIASDKIHKIIGSSRAVIGTISYPRTSPRHQHQVLGGTGSFVSKHERHSIPASHTNAVAPTCLQSTSVLWQKTGKRVSRSSHKISTRYKIPGKSRWIPKQLGGAGCRPPVRPDTQLPIIEHTPALTGSTQALYTLTSVECCDVSIPSQSRTAPFAIPNPPTRRLFDCPHTNSRLMGERVLL